MNEIINDKEGNSYRTIKIGNQTWMVENLKTSLFTDGSPISMLTSNYEWQNVDAPCQCLYDNKEANLNFGRLYNWFCINQGDICPSGWRIPTIDDWQTLAENFGGFATAGMTFQRENEFNAQLVGSRFGSFEGLGQSVFYWTANTDENQPTITPPGKTSKAICLKKDVSIVSVSEEYQIEGFYIRCIKI
jgi:uncharacterized protein (TIGR02145 family)